MSGNHMVDFLAYDFELLVAKTGPACVGTPEGRDTHLPVCLQPFSDLLRWS